jgi:hypothetical protein
MDYRRTVRAVYENGEVTFAEPVELDGCWHIEITFLEREDPNTLYEVSPHRPELGSVPGRIEELHRHMETQKPTSHY